MLEKRRNKKDKCVKRKTHEWFKSMAEKGEREADGEVRGKG